MSAEREGERILYESMFHLWYSCTDPLRRRRYKVVLDMHRTRMVRMGFTEAELRDIENFGDMRREALRS